MEKYQAVQEFINLAEKNHRIETLDKIYWRNQLLHFLGMNDWDEPQVTEEHDALTLMDQLMILARDNQAFSPEEEEFYEAALMDLLVQHQVKLIVSSGRIIKRVLKKQQIIFMD